MVKEISNLQYKFISIVLFWIIAGSLVLPGGSFYGFGLRLSDILIMFAVPCLYFYQPSLPKYKIFLLYFFFVFSTMLSLIYGYYFLDVPQSMRDFNEIIKTSMPLLVMIIFVKVDLNFFCNLIIKFLFYGSIFVLTVAALEYLFPMDIGYKIHMLYDPDYQLADCTSGRIFVTGSGPNTGAAIVLLFLQYNIIAFLIKKNLRYVFLTVFLTLAMLLTGSRTVVIALALSSLTVLILTYKYSRLYSLLVLVVMMLLCIIFIPKIPYIYTGLKTVLLGTNTSVLARIGNIKEAYLLFKQSVFLGWGPAKNLYPTILDNEYFLILRRYGIIGLLSLFIFMSYNIVRILNNIKSLYVLDSNTFIISVLVVSYTVAMAVVMLTNNFISGYQLFVPYVLLTSFVHLKINKIKHNFYEARH